MQIAGKVVVRYRPRGSTVGWHKEQVKCDACLGTGLVAVRRRDGTLPRCPGCNGRGYTVDWTRHAAVKAAE